jgi:hypothetical protein
MDGKFCIIKALSSRRVEGGGFYRLISENQPLFLRKRHEYFDHGQFRNPGDIRPPPKSPSSRGQQSRLMASVESNNRYVPLAAVTIAALLGLLIPLRIIGYGFLPPDDALVDAAKAVSGKPWPEILILNSDYKIDNHIGWHTVLRKIYLVTKWSDESLVLFSMTAMFALIGWSGLPWIKRPEAWLITLGLTLGVQAQFIYRFMLGRPLAWSAMALISILFLTQARSSSPPDKRCLAAMTCFIALAVCLHGVWYFWALPVAAFFFARQVRWGLALACCWIAGTLLGALLTGQPVVYLMAAWQQAWNVIGQHDTQGTMALELRSMRGNWFPLFMLGGLVVLRQLARIPARPWRTEPAFWLACFGWVLGYQTERFWDDWGMPALMVLTTLDLDLFLQSRLAHDSWQRVGLAAGLAATVFIMATNDADTRWSSTLHNEYVSADDPNLAGWLPGNGGIFYEADMNFFYQTFYKNPTAAWRYTVGFEPIFMPPEDFAIYQKILVNHGNPDAYRPWANKMRPQDRLVIGSSVTPASFFPELEWKYTTIGTYWLGRLPQKH